MEKETAHLNLLDLFQESKEKLSLNEIDNTYPEEECLSFLNGKEIPIVSEKKYVSILTVENRNENIYYPLYFCLMEKQKLLPESVVFNQVAIQFFADIGITLKEDMSPLEIRNIYSTIKKELDRTHANDKADVRFSLSFFDESVLLFNHSYPFLYDFVINNIQDKKYEGVFRELKTQKQEDEVFDQSFGFFAKQIRVLERLNQYQGTKVIVKEKGILQDFIQRFLDFSIENKYRVLFVGTSEILDEARKNIDESGLEDFVHTINSDKYSDLVSLLKDRTFNSVTTDEEYDYNTILQKEEQYRVYEAKREECFFYPKNMKNLSYFKELEKENDLLAKTYPLNVEGYNEIDYEQDEKFCLLLDELETVKNSYITNHPYYGLTTRDSRSNYDSLQLVIISVMNRIRDLIHLTQDECPLSSYNLNMRTLEEVDSICEDGKVLKGYNGFPRKYFKLNQDTESKYSLAKLKNLFQTLSSTKMIINILCKEEVFNDEIENLVADYRSTKFFAKFKAKKKLQKYCKSNSEDLSSIVDVIERYLNTQKEINELLPSYIEVYGDSISTMNGVLEIQSNIDYIHLFNKRGEVNPSFNLEDPFVKRCLKDKEFRISSISYIDELKTAVDELKKALVQYQKYYLDIPSFGFEKQIFEELLQSFFHDSLLTFDEFSEYAKFKAKLDESSILLRLTIRKYQEKERPLTEFSSEYRLSLLNSYHNKGKEAFEEYRVRYCKAFLDYQNALFRMKHALNRNRYGKYQKLVEGFKNELVYQNQRQRILDNMDIGASLQDKNDLWGLVSENYPICFVEAEKLYLIPDNIFDVVVVYDSSLLSNVELINSYRVAEKIIFIGKDDKNDGRIQGYHQSIINRDSFTKAFDFLRLPEKFIDYMKRESEKHQMTLIRDSAQFPLKLVGETMEYAIIPDILLTYEHDPEMIVELSRYMAMNENLVLYCFDTYDFVFEPDHIFEVIHNGKEN